MHFDKLLEKALTVLLPVEFPCCKVPELVLKNKYKRNNSPTSRLRRCIEMAAPLLNGGRCNTSSTTVSAHESHTILAAFAGSSDENTINVVVFLEDLALGHSCKAAESDKMMKALISDQGKSSSTRVLNKAQGTQSINLTTYYCFKHCAKITLPI